MGWNITPTGRGGYYASQSGGSGGGGPMILVYLICAIPILIGLANAGWGRTWFIWVPLLLLGVVLVVRWFNNL